MGILSFIRNNAPSIFTGLALGGLVETFIFTIDAAIKSVRICDELGIDMQEHPIEALDATWRLWMLPGFTLIGTGACIFGVYSSLSREVTGFAAAYSLAEAKYNKRIAAEKDVFGEQYEAIEQYIRDHEEHAPMPVSDPNEGMMWCYEPESDQWFQATTQSILHAELVANKMFANRGELRFNQFLELLPGCKKVAWGDHYGWFKYDDEGYWDYNWSFYPGATPWIDIQPQIDPDKGILVIKYGMHPGDDLDCNDLEQPEQFVMQNTIDWDKKIDKLAKNTCPIVGRDD